MPYQTFIAWLLLIFIISPQAQAYKNKSNIEQWHTITHNFEGPTLAETAKNNPFLNYKLQVRYTHQQSGKTFDIPGYFAADGNAAETSATKGNIWQVKFNPPKQGLWHYQASLYQGEKVAIAKTLKPFKRVTLKNAKGSFKVSPSTKKQPDFRARGQLIIDNGYFKFSDSQQYWLKSGTNSPENLLGFIDFDGTYRIDAPARDGEAAPNQSLHKFKKHIKDWQTGDPTWQGGKGKAIIGGINYLAAQGVNSAYFLTLNILGDGKDVWPYINHQDFTRFDVSKLAQWEILFEHMQSKGILLHIVIQETENETMLDDGNTGELRQLYLNELIARFGHHLALVWNLGEENGYAKWSPKAQNTAQRKQMADHLKTQDPLKHPVLLHTHAHDPDREKILTPLLGYKNIDGLSLQQDKRENVNQVINRWKKNSKSAGHQWLITMDEIGMWHTAALPDSVDPTHLSLQRHALWGALLAGGAGVEWYFGAKHPHNDLTSEDWRQRKNLWQITTHARTFIEQHIPFWQLNSCPITYLDKSNGYCAEIANNMQVMYLFEKESIAIELPHKATKIQWFDPATGVSYPITSSPESLAQNILTMAPHKTKQDWVVIFTSKN